MIDSLFGSKTRVKLLYLFLNNPGRAFYVREITRRVDEQINSVRRELANMLSVGVIKSDGVDNKLYYEVDQTYTFYKPLQQIFSQAPTDVQDDTQELKLTTDWAKRLKKLTGVQAVILSGGLVSGSRSKVDVLIVGAPPKTQVRKFIADLEEDEHRSLHYTVISFDDFYYRLSMKDRFVAEIVGGKHKVILDVKNVVSSEKVVKE